MMLFFVGVIEMLIISTWTKAVTETKVVVSGVFTVINVLIWYYVLDRVVNDMGNWFVVATYAIGCALGTVLSTLYFRQQDIKKQEVLKPILAKDNLAK